MCFLPISSFYGKKQGRFGGFYQLALGFFGLTICLSRVNIYLYKKQLGIALPICAFRLLFAGARTCMARRALRAGDSCVFLWDIPNTFRRLL
jgi:hypothetical protein